MTAASDWSGGADPLPGAGSLPGPGEAALADILRLSLDALDTPIGRLYLAVDHGGHLRVALFAESDAIVRRQLRHDYGERGFDLETCADPDGITERVHRYFAGALDVIDAIPVATAGTSFQREVWRALREIPCGTTTSYGALARKIGRPDAGRAVGHANGSNPVAVIVPCHRVIGANGSLTGYGGGIERKRWLLRHEQSGSLFA
jgi:methylated-DNA-[protein]-cysteine S-methyltransferase